MPTKFAAREKQLFESLPEIFTDKRREERQGPRGTY